MALSEVQKDKLSFRKKIQDILLSFDAQTRQERSGKIREAFFSLSTVAKSRRIFVYVSSPEEVETHDIIQELLRRGKKVFLPAVDLKTKEIRVYELLAWEDLRPGAYGILEPPKHRTRLAEPGSLDLVVVPAVAFDVKGNRLGRGGGYFDRFLKKTAKAFKLGLAFEAQLAEVIPLETHDVAVDGVLTEKLFYYCGRSFSK